MNKDTKDLLNTMEGFTLWMMVLKFVEINNVVDYVVDSGATVIRLEKYAGVNKQRMVVPPDLENIVKELINTANKRSFENERNSQSTDRNENS